MGNRTNPQNATASKDRVVAVWFERALDWRNSTTARATGKSSWIDAAWTDTSSKANWTRLADKELIGPCMAASNPVTANGKVYVACIADKGSRR